MPSDSHGQPADKPAASRSAYAKLSPRQKLWVSKYLETSNASEASRLAGYTDGPGISVTGHRLLTSDRIQAAIAESLAGLDISINRSLVPIADALTANKPVIDPSDKTIVDYPDHATRLKASEVALGLLGYKPAKERESKTVAHQHQHIHVQSMSVDDMLGSLQGAIDITPGTNSDKTK